MKKAVILCVLILTLTLTVNFTVPGFQTHSHVTVHLPETGEDGSVTFFAGEMGSAGYLRDCRLYTVDQKTCLRFYGAFGGINGSVGARERFTVTPPENCTELYLIVNEEARLVLEKDEAGQWHDTVQIPPERKNLY